MFLKKLIHHKYLLSWIILLIVLEIFLRLTQHRNPSFNFYSLLNNPSWDIQHTTSMLPSSQPSPSKITLYHTKTDCPKQSPYQTTYTIDKPDHITRIICLGSSATEGYGIASGQQVYSSLLEKELNTSKQQYQVINAGISGYIGFQLSRYYQDILSKLSPDIVVVYLGSNDTILQKNIATYLKHKKIEALISNHSIKITNQKELFSYLNLRFPNKLSCKFFDILAQSYLFIGLVSFKNYLFDKFITPHKEQPEIEMDIAKKSLAHIISISKQIKTNVILIPEIYDSFDFCSKEYAKVMKNLAAQNKNTFFLDLRLPLKKQAKKGDITFLDYIHPTPKGHQIIASAIAEFILDLHD